MSLVIRDTWLVMASFSPATKNHLQQNQSMHALFNRAR
jgi:hypothetical protein